MAKDMPHEMIERRLSYSKTWDLGRRKRLTENICGTPLHMADGDDVDFRPARANNAALDGWRITQGNWHYALGKPGDKATDGWVGFGGLAGRNWFKWRLLKLGYLHWPTRAWQDIGGAPTYDRADLNHVYKPVTFGPEGAKVDCYPTSVVTWANIWSIAGTGIDIRWLLDGRQLREKVAIPQTSRDWIQANRPPGTPIAETYFGFVFELDASDIPRWWRAGFPLDSSGDNDVTGPLEMRTALNEILAVMPISTASVTGVEGSERQIRKRLWRDGSRLYLLLGLPVATVMKMPQGELVFDPTVDESVGQSSDDCVRTDSYFSLTSEEWSPDRTTAGREFGARFQTVAIDNGATIDTSYMTVMARSTNSSPSGGGTLYGHDADDSATFSDDTDYMGRARTTASSHWAPTAWVDGTNYNSPSLNAVIAEITSRAGWASGNNLSILNDCDEDDWIEGQSQDNQNGDPGPRLHVEWTAAGGQDYPVSVSLSRVAALTTGAQAAALGSASLGRSAGVADGSQSAASAAASLARSAGVSATRVMGAARTVSLGRSSGVSASGLAAALAAASLARQAGVTDTGQAAALGSTLLERTAGMTEAGSAQALASVLTEIFAGLSSSGTASAEAGTVLALDLGAVESAQAGAVAETALARQQAVSLVAQALALTGVTFSLTRGLATDGSTVVVFEVPSERVYIVLAEDRAYIVPMESRSYTVPAEDRACTVPAESRVYTVSAEDRTYTVPGG